MSAADLLREVVQALDNAGIPHMLVGSFASTSHGAPRSTQDIDVVIDPTPEALVRFVASFDEADVYVSSTVLAVGGDDLDHGYLDHWAAELGVTELLARARCG